MKMLLITLMAVLSSSIFGQELPCAGTWIDDGNYPLSLIKFKGYDSTAGVWTWFNEPRAVYHNNNTYFAAVDNKGNLKVVQYENAMDSTRLITLGFFQIDDHVNPALRLTKENKIEVYYSKHGGADYFRQRSNKAEDITSWHRKTNLDDQYGLSNYSYANIVELDDTVFNFFRGVPKDGSTYTLHFSKSTDDGVTWTAPVKLLTGERPYFKVIKNGSNRIDIICNDGHPNKTVNNSTYHFYYQGGWHKSDGTNIGSPPFTPSEDLTKIYDGAGTDGKSWVWDVAINNLNYPVCVFNTTGTETAHKYHYAYWDGDNWEVKTIVENAGTHLYDAEPQYSGGMAIDPDNTSIVYCSVETDGLHKLWRYETHNHGTTWTSKQLTKEKAFRPFVIAGAPVGKRILYITGVYTTYTNYDTYIKFLDRY
jgi:hypothetical protein